MLKLPKNDSEKFKISISVCQKTNKVGEVQPYDIRVGKMLKYCYREISTENLRPPMTLEGFGRVCK